MDAAITDTATFGDFSASWSNRNGGEILVTVGSMRMTVSAALARAVHAKLGKALDVPVRAASLVGARDDRPLASEPERIPAPDTMIAEPLRHRKGALIGAFPARAKRLAAIARAMEHGDAGAEIVAIGGIPFLRSEAEAMLALNAAEQIEGRSFEGSAFGNGCLTIDGESEPGAWERHLRDAAVMRGDEGAARA